MIKAFLSGLWVMASIGLRYPLWNGPAPDF